MFKRRETAAPVETLIGKGVSVQGDIEFSGGLHIDGRVTGSVRALAGAPAALSVSEHGVIEGSVAAPSVVLNGRVHGDIDSSGRVSLGASARVRGNVQYGAIEMALGAEISGRLVSQTRPATSTAVPVPVKTAVAPSPPKPARQASLESRS
ncbi:MAG: polymer-forming cytoskeletal protein [Steroidobacteraceae bacterium]